MGETSSRGVRINLHQENLNAEPSDTSAACRWTAAYNHWTYIESPQIGKYIESHSDNIRQNFTHHLDGCSDGRRSAECQAYKVRLFDQMQRLKQWGEYRVRRTKQLQGSYSRARADQHRAMSQVIKAIRVSRAYLQTKPEQA